MLVSNDSLVILAHLFQKSKPKFQVFLFFFMENHGRGICPARTDTVFLCHQQPQPLSQPQPQPLLVAQVPLLPPQQQNRRIRIMMIHRQLPPPQPKPLPHPIRCTSYLD